MPAAVSEDLRWAIIKMDAFGVARHDICHWTGVSLRSVQRFVQLWKEKGVTGSKKSTGRRSKISSDDFMVSKWLSFSLLDIDKIIVSDSPSTRSS